MPVKKAVLVAFSVRTEKFDSPSERNKFFRTLYGWTQTVPKENKQYTYHRRGILDEMPHEKVDQSSFIIPEDNFDTVVNFFEEWTNKVIWKTFKVLLEDGMMEEMFRAFEEEEDD